MKDGKIQRDVMQIVLANVRTPEEREGDLMAQVMSNGREKRGCSRSYPAMDWRACGAARPSCRITASG